MYDMFFGIGLMVSSFVFFTIMILIYKGSDDFDN